MGIRFWRQAVRSQATDKETQSGYDAPESVRERDDLDRWRFAAELATLISGTPSNWSVRIGVFGKWGEGKTTVLRFLEKIELARGNVVVWFNPWAISSHNELWMEFAKTLLESLKKAGISDVGKRASSKLYVRKAEKFVEPLEKLAESIPYAKAPISAGLSLLRRVVSISASDLTQIRTQLAGRHVVIMIDDLDRTDPKLIPRLLLTLKELLDLPGFAFVLAFDNEIVARALTEYHSAWKGGQDFLEKILDFRFTLPPLTTSQTHRLLNRELEELCPFVDRTAVDQVADLFPTNPRKLKSLVRSLATLKSEVLRHDPEELKWVDIVIAHLMKVESPLFLDRIVESPILDEQIGVGYFVNRDLSEKDKADSQLEDFLTQMGITDPSKARMVQLMQALRSRSVSMEASQFRYQAQLASRPHKITWREFGLVFSTWKESKNLSEVDRWIADHAKARAALPEEVAAELFDSLINYRKQKLNDASDSTSLNEQEQAMAEAKQSLELTSALINNGLEGRCPETCLSHS